MRAKTTPALLSDLRRLLDLGWRNHRIAVELYVCPTWVTKQARLMGYELRYVRPDQLKP